MNCVALSSLLLAVVACGPKPGPGGGAGGSATGVLPDVPFDEYDHEQKIQFMKQKVMPTMAPLFQRHDPQRFARFDCKTCHGPIADRGEYHMPNDKLPKLNLADLRSFDPRNVAFMQNLIKPTMARLLKQPEFSEENTDGFGCMGCHTRVQ